MHPLGKKTLHLIEKEGLLLPGEIVVVGVSAGPDSMALLHVLASLRPFLRLGLVAVYVDHGLRPEETDQEAALVREAAQGLAIPFRLGRVDVRKEARSRKLSLEHAGRLLRYAWLEKVAAEEQASKIAVAHTADDQVEELLIRLLRGAGRPGLAGMRKVRDERIVRPFLGVAKEELVAYLQEKQLSWHEDSTNRQPIYLRNRIRLELLPHLEERFNPRLRRNLLQTATILQDEEDLLTALTREARERIVTRTTEADLPVLSFRRASFAGIPKAIQRRLVEGALREMGHDPSFRQIEQVLRLSSTEGGDRQVHLAGGLRVTSKGERVYFAYPRGPGGWRGDLEQDEARRFQLAIPAPGGEYEIPSLGKTIRVEHLEQVPSDKELRRPGADYLESARLSFPLCLRSPMPGDRFRPFGASGHQKISDFLSNNKVPAGKRWRVPVLLSGAEVVALLGMRIGHQVRVTPATRAVIRFTWVDKILY